MSSDSSRKRGTASGSAARLNVESATSPWNVELPKLKEIGRRTWNSMSQDDLTARSAQLAYYFFFSLFPGLIAASAMLGFVASAGRDFSKRLLDYLGNLIPPSAFQMVSEVFTQTTHAASGGKLLLGIIAALWSASAGTAAIQESLNAVHKVKEGRPYWRVRLQAVALTVMIVALLTLALSVLLCSDVAVEYLSRYLRAHTMFVILTRILAWPIAFGVISVAFALVYYIAPDVKEAAWKWITPGAVIGILVWLLASAGLRVYLHFFDSYSVTYGSLGAVIVLLTWFYLSGLALLLGAEINSVVESIAAEHGEPEARQQGEKVA